MCWAFLIKTVPLRVNFIASCKIIFFLVEFSFYFNIILPLRAHFRMS